MLPIVGSRVRKPLVTVAKILAIAFLIISLFFTYEAWAKPTTEVQARRVVENWLALDRQPLGAILGDQIKEVKTFSDPAGNPLYFIVYLNPSGFVIVAGDDLVEPIIGFVPKGYYDPSPANPLGALVSRDVPGRVAMVREMEYQAGEKGLEFTPMAIQRKAQRKWGMLDRDTLFPQAPEFGLPSISDVRVYPFVESAWGQGSVGDWPWTEYCYNYYTPTVALLHYPCGCAATAMAQLMRYYCYPLTGVGTELFPIYVDGTQISEPLLGGDGTGGPYNWDQMPLAPTILTPEDQRQMIGRLTHDAGVAVNTEYTLLGSGAYATKIPAALRKTFNYSNAKIGLNILNNSTYNIPGSALNRMMNPNLDAKFPVLLEIFKSSPAIEGEPAHYVVCDGYGYNLTTLFHHLNMGMEGEDDAWYNLPNIDTPSINPDYTSVGVCIYNVYNSDSEKEIISGRVVDLSGNPIFEANVTATKEGGGTYTTTTNARGIYALAKVPLESTYTITVSKTGYSFGHRVVRTEKSNDNSVDTGNLWGIDFVADLLKWGFKMQDHVPSSPAIGADGTIYVGSDGNYIGYLYAMNPNGTPKWAYQMGWYVKSSPAIGADGTIYVGSSYPSPHHFFARNPDGTLKWAYEMPGEVSSSPAVGIDGTIYVGSSYYLYALNPNGTLKWPPYQTGDVVASSPAIGRDGTIYVGSDQNLYAINPDGTLKWKFVTGYWGYTPTSPAIGRDGTIYVGFDVYLYAIYPNGIKKWSYRTGNSVFSSPAIGKDGTIYVGSSDFKFYALNPDGTLKWQYETMAPVNSSPAIGRDGTIYVGSGSIGLPNGSLYALNPNGTLKWQYEVGSVLESSPVISADGTVYVGSGDGNLYAFKGTAGGLANTPWPMFHHDVKHTGRSAGGKIAGILQLLLD